MLKTEDQALVDDLTAIVTASETKLLGNVDQKLRALEAEWRREIRERTARAPAMTLSAGSDAMESAGSRFVRSEEYKAWAGGPGQRGRAVVAVGAFPFETKATILNPKPGPTRLPDVAPYPAFPPNFVSALNWRPVTATDEVTFLRETRRATPGAKTAPPTTTKSEQDFDIQPVTSALLTIACWTSTTLQALADISQLERFIDQSLIALTMSEIDRQALIGGGATPTPPELYGVVGGATAYEVARNKTGDTKLDTIAHAATQLAEKGVSPNLVVLHPSDVEGIHLTKATDGTYVVGAPAGTGALPSLWGLRIVTDAWLSANTFLIGDSSTAEILDRQSAVVELSREHSDYFVRNMAVLRCELRAGLALYVPAAWVTGSFPTTP